MIGDLLQCLTASFLSPTMTQRILVQRRRPMRSSSGTQLLAAVIRGLNIVTVTAELTAALIRSQCPATSTLIVSTAHTVLGAIPANSLIMLCHVATERLVAINGASHRTRQQTTEQLVERNDAGRQTVQLTTEQPVVRRNEMLTRIGHATDVDIVIILARRLGTVVLPRVAAVRALVSSTTKRLGARTSKLV